MVDMVLDGAAVADRAQLHEILARELPLPPWYGKNLDALFDCLTDLREETVIRLLHPAALSAALGPYAAALERVLRRAQEENPCLRLVVEADADR